MADERGCGVILAPMSGYIHGTDPREQQRLELLNRLTNRGFIEFLQVRAEDRVLEVGSGIGILAGEVASSAEGVQVVGVEVSPQQIAAARPHARVRYLQADAHHLEFADASFDLVYARYVLEHVADPVRVLSEMRRVTKPGGRVAAMENDSSLIRFDPPCPAFESAWAAFMAYQAHIGGDATVGRRLFRLFREAGFTGIELSIQPEVHWSGSPGFQDWIEDIAGNLESAQSQLLDSRFCTAEAFKGAVHELQALKSNPSGSAVFAWNRVKAIR